MKCKNTTRNALFTSIISLLLCMSMLVGTTFAWFTDTAASGLNEIIAGNLDVALLDNAGNSVEGNAELFTMPELWEPGAVAYAQIQVANKGTLDLKASLSINYEDVNSIDGHVLSEVLKYAIIDASNVDLSSREAVLAAAKASTNKGALSIYDFSIELQAGQVSDLQTLVIFWEPNADNVDNLYNVNNGKTTSDGNPLQINLGVKVFATQLGGNNDNENDSFGTDYDENAPTIITVGNDTTVYATIGEAYAATNSTSFNVSGPIDMTKLGDLFATANQNVTFNQIAGSATAYYDFSKTAVNVNGASITINGGYIQGMRSNTGNGFGFQHTTGTITYNNVTINDSWTNEHGATVAYNNCVFTGTYYVWTYSVPSITFNGCIFDKEDSRAILVYSHGNNPIAATVNNCKFYAEAKGYTGDPAWTAAVEVNANNIPSGATVNITNCTADGNYNGIVRDKGGKNATITVDGNPLVTSQAAFDAAIAEGKTNIYLAAGNYKLPNVQGKNITLTGAGTGTVVDYSHMGQYQEVSGSSFVFKNMTVVNAETGYPYPGLQHITSVSYEDCHIVGTVNLFAPATFTNCTFDSKSAEHNVVTYSSDSVTFTNCKFTYGDRAVNCYAEDASSRDVVVTFTDCEFTKVAGKDAVGAIETNGCHTNSLTVNINNCTVNEGQMVYISEYDTTAGGKTSITVDGEDVYVVAVGNQWTDAASDAAVLKAALTSDKKNITVVLLEDVEGDFGHSSELGGANTETITIDGNGHKLTLTKNYMPGFWLANDDGKLVINNATITAVRESGTWDVYDINFDNDTELNNVTFEKAVSLSGVGDTYVLNDVSISETHDYYALWISADGANVTIDGLNIDSAGRGIKIDDEYQGANVAKVTLKVSNADFNTNSKAAIMVKSAEGADIALANVDISGVAADTSNAVWVDEDAAAYADKVTVVGGIKIVEP